VQNTCTLEFLNHYFIMCSKGVGSCMMPCYCWQGLLTNKTVFLPGFVCRTMFQINNGGEYGLFSEIILA